MTVLALKPVLVLMGVECAHAPDQIGKHASIEACLVLINSVEVPVHLISKPIGNNAVAIHHFTIDVWAVVINSFGHACAADWQAELQPQQCRSAGGGAEQGEPQGAQHHQPTGEEQGAQRRLCLCRSHSLQPPFEHCQVRCEIPTDFDIMIGQHGFHLH